VTSPTDPAAEAGAPHPAEVGPTAVTERIRALLDGAGVAYRYLEHDPTRTCEESAAARGETTRVGGKALVLKVGEVFRLCVLRADCQVNSNRVRRHFKQSRARFANREELDRLTGLVPGSVPPFGEPVLPLPNCLDRSFLDNDRIAFNAGSLRCSIVMPLGDYLRLAEPEIFDYAKPPLDA
jgi:prolyl-tRNA editing enzyme YbaK/EbsC (Cys-tRNA(Pro) deacylase)